MQKEFLTKPFEKIEYTDLDGVVQVKTWKFYLDPCW